ncbi:unnamed protein product [Macrosiphum euphorbiae]|uniref:RRM domain-containing protein n=1 Tax=Macrosiphum euphorbiae TaxID=13131 RepID=A0AAV0W2S9_9HEMI|nr:unnamed protein product [Macrosiphum euphorbiae]
MREAGDVCYADVYKDGSGVVEFLRYDDMKYAVRKLDDSRFRSHEGEVTYIRGKDDYAVEAVVAVVIIIVAVVAAPLAIHLEIVEHQHIHQLENVVVFKISFPFVN